MVTPLLQMQKISKRFPGVIALDGVDLSVYPGEVVGLAGENGAGKSTLMKILGGVYHPDGGTISVNGQEVSIHDVSNALDRGIGFVHQELNILDNLTIAENVFLGREPRYLGFLIDRRGLNNAAKICLERLGLQLPPSTPLRELSIAQQQLVEIAKALSQNARLLILDEPTSSLTLTETGRLLQVIEELRTDGVSVIYISHRLGEIRRIADRVFVLRDGRNAGTLSRKEISHNNIVKLMVGRNIENRCKSAAAVPSKEFAKITDLRTLRYPNTPNTFDLRKGEILGFAGLVGAGRSETAQAIFGVDRPVSAKITLDGKRIDITSARDAIDNGVFLVPEDRRLSGLIVDLPIRENITLPALRKYSTAGIVSRDHERRTAAEMCVKLGVKAPSPETLAANLSGGNQQKVVLAKWLSLDPRIMIFDEPTRGVDVGAKEEIYQLMRGLARTGVAIMLISSDMEEILGESDRVAVMHEGKITGILSRTEVSEEAIMKLAVGASEPPDRSGG